MTDSDTLERLQALVLETPPNKAHDLIQRAYELGKSEGRAAAAEERERFRDAHMTIAEALRSIGILTMGDRATVEGLPPPAKRGYGDIISLVTAAIDEIAPTRTFGALEVRSQIVRQHPGSSIKLAQVRSAIKTLMRTNRAERVSKGRYRMLRQTHGDHDAALPAEGSPSPQFLQLGGCADAL